MSKSIFQTLVFSLLAAAVILATSRCKRDDAFLESALPDTSELAHSHEGRRCNIREHEAALLQKHPEIGLQRQQIERFTQDFIAAGGAQDRTVVTIPVVFHVLWNVAAENVSDAQIQSQLTVMNNDFRRLNADKVNTPAPFQGISADCEINFCLAQRDPAGNATTGITRRQTPLANFPDNEMFFYSQGGTNIWDRNKYLNIYICDIDGLGFAYFPGAPADIDGAVIDYQAFGTNGSAQAPYNLGRTASHEIGHWLNLEHIWGPNDEENPSCSDSDNVTDTPNQSNLYFGCPSFPQLSCSNGPNGDMFMNYMDYVDDGCMNAFSTGQKNRMHALFAPGGQRASLATSQGCSPPSGNNCGVPGSLTASNIAQTTATVGWATVSGAVSYTLKHKPTASATWTTTTGITTNSKNLTGLTAGTAYQFQVQTVCSGGSSAFSSIATFTTAAAGCTDIYESNNTSSTAKNLVPNANITAKIGTTTDVDWFKFVNTTAKKNIRISLTNLPDDYDVFLFRNNVQVASSENGGTDNEEIVYNTSIVGTYRVKIIGYDGVFDNTNCYSLGIETSATPFGIIASPTGSARSGKSKGSRN